MERKNLLALTAVAGVAGVGLVAIAWRVKPAKAAELIGIYYWDEDEGSWVGLKGATLQEGMATIGVLTRNKFSEALNLRVALNGAEDVTSVLPNEEVMFSFLVSLAAGPNTLTAILTEEVTEMPLDSMSADFTVRAGEAEFVPSNFRISPTEVEVGDQIQFRWTVTNIGGESGTHHPILEGAIDRTPLAFALGPGENRDVIFSVTVPALALGTHNVYADGLPGVFTVVGVAPITAEIKSINYKRDTSWLPLAGVEFGAEAVGAVLPIGIEVQNTTDRGVLLRLETVIRYPDGNWYEPNEGSIQGVMFNALQTKTIEYTANLTQSGSYTVKADVEGRR